MLLPAPFRLKLIGGPVAEHCLLCSSALAVNRGYGSAHVDMNGDS